MSKILDLQAGLVVGLHAVEYLALRIAQAGRDFEWVGEQDKTGTCVKLLGESEAVLSGALRKVSDLLNALGDFDNAHDGTSEDDVKATQHAFELLRRLLQE